MIRAVRRIQLIAPASVVLLVGVAAAVTVAAVADPPTSRARSAAFGCVPVSGSTGGGLDAAQERNAKIIISVALGRGLGPTGAAIGVSIALAESTLFNYANHGTSTLVGSAEGRQLNDAERAVARESLQFPHDRVGNNLDSIGLFQQRPMTGWGAPAELIDPATSAGKFFDRLVHVPGWQGMPPWNAAQTVQGSPSSDSGIYRDIYEQATGIVTTLTTIGGTAVAVPVGNSVPGCGSPSVAQVAVTGGGGSAAWGGYENGRIPASALCPVPSAPWLLLECGAVAAFDQLNGAFRAVFGQDIGITDGYRSYDEQVACRAEKSSLCADPGTSNHGWAKAVDIGACCGVNTGGGAAFDLADRERCGRLPRPDGVRGQPFRGATAVRRVHLRALDQHPGARVRRRPQVLRHLRRSGRAGGVGVLDLSERWTGDINTVRAKDGLPQFSTDSGLVDRARSCASSRAGRGGDCPRSYFFCRLGTGMVFGAWDYGPGDLDRRTATQSRTCSARYGRTWRSD